MKLKILGIILICTLFFSKHSIAQYVEINHMEVSINNLVNGNVYVPTGSSVSLTFTVFFTVTGTPQPTYFILGSYNSNNATHTTATPVLSISASDANGLTFGKKSFTQTVSAANLTYNNIELIYGAFGSNSSFTQQSQILYAVTHSNVVNTAGYVAFYNEAFLNDNATSTNRSYVPLVASNTNIQTSTSPILIANQTLYSSSGNYKLILQGDGNLVLYRSSDNYIMWTTDTNGSNASYLWFQTDGNLVLTSTSNPSTVVWASNIYANSGNPFSNNPNFVNQFGLAQNAIFVLQNDGNLVMEINSQYTDSTGNHSGLYQVLGDTGSGNNTRSQHYDRIE